MVNRFLFKDRDGRTLLPAELRKGLIPKAVKTSEDLDIHEERNILEGLVWLEDFRGDHIDWMFWEKLHKKLFGNVWKWAGQFRQYELDNPDFDHPGQIKQNIKKLEGDLKFWLTKKSFDDSREAIARFHERLLTIHPYPNGNGRMSRILAEHICERENIPVPTWSVALKEKNPKSHREAYISAIVKARRSGDFADLTAFMYS